MSRGVVEARAVLLAPRTDQIIASRSFSLARLATSADALGGAGDHHHLADKARHAATASASVGLNFS